MSERIYEEFMLDIFGMESVEVTCFPSSTGTFSLRQADYYAREGRLLLNAEQMRTMTRLLPEGNPAAKQQLIAFYLRKVVNMARRYTQHGLALLDLVNEGIAGLIQALEKFEFEGGIRFSTYATQCIRHHIEQAIMGRNAHFLASFQTAAAVA